MKKASLVVLLGTFTILTGGCSNIPFLGGGDEEVVAPTSPEQASNPEVKPEKAVKSVDGKVDPKKAKAVPTGLIQSTSAPDRIIGIQKGRTDPFDTISIEPVVKVSPIPGKTVSSVPSVGSIPPTRGGGNTGNTGKTGSTGSGTKTNRTTPRTSPPNTNILPSKPTSPNNTGNGGTNNRNGNATPPTPKATIREPSLNKPPLPIPELPPPPQPTLARAVEITGVVQAGGVPQAIVQEPDSEFQRYVKVGDYLANGQVLVKRIEMTSGPQPVVILQQLGVEVSRRVGEKPITAQGDPANPAS
ncbi:MAG: hypothetical protein WA865_04190 [Spirulinaceae cyanobacterium]